MTTVTERMKELLDQWNAIGDHRAIFLACYRCMTENMLIAVTRREFHDPVWVHQLIGNFADYYFMALEAWNKEAGGPPVWQHTFACTMRRETSIVQHLLLGINAHINYDLVLVLDDLLRPEWHSLSDRARQERQADYNAVNRVIAITIDRVQDEIIAPYARAMPILDITLGPLDEWCTTHLIRSWRNNVWQQAQQLLAINHSADRLIARQQVDHIATERARSLSGGRAFGYPLRWLARLNLI